MIVFRHELRQGRIGFAVWTVSIAFLLVICIFLFPEMKDEMETMGDMFSSMGSFTAAFGMDRLNFGTLIGFYSIECGNILGLGGAFFASLIGTSTQITAMNLIILVLSVLSIGIIGEDVPWKEILMMHGAYYLLQLELACICFGISSFLYRSSTGIGIGLAAMMYFINLVSNMSQQAESLKYITPFAYCEGADIISNGKLDIGLIMIGMLFACAGITTAYIRYSKKDIR